MGAASRSCRQTRSDSCFTTGAAAIGRSWRGSAPAYPSWSRDGTFLHFRDLGQHRICRLRIRDARLEPVASLKGVRQLSTLFGGWVGLAPDDIPLAVNGLEHQEIYALEWEAP